MEIYTDTPTNKPSSSTSSPTAKVIPPTSPASATSSLACSSALPLPRHARLTKLWVRNALLRPRPPLSLSVRTTSSDTLPAYDTFANNFCPNNRQVSTITVTTSLGTSTSTSTSTSISSFAPSSSAPPFPSGNTTTILSTGDTGQPITLVAPTSLITTSVIVTTTDSNGRPTATSKQTTVPAEPTEYEDEGVPAFGAVRATMLAGGIGFLALVFAEL